MMTRRDDWEEREPKHDLDALIRYTRAAELWFHAIGIRRRREAAARLECARLELGIEDPVEEKKKRAA